MGSGSSTAAGPGRDAEASQLPPKAPIPPAGPKPGTSGASSPRYPASRKTTQELAATSSNTAEGAVDRPDASPTPVVVTDPAASPLRTSAAARAIATPAAWVGSTSGDCSVTCVIKTAASKETRASPQTTVTELQAVEASQDSLLKPGSQSQQPALTRASLSQQQQQQQQQQQRVCSASGQQPGSLTATGRLNGAGKASYRDRRGSSISQPDDTSAHFGRLSQGDEAWASLQAQYRISDPQSVLLVALGDLGGVPSCLQTASTGGPRKSLGGRRRSSLSATVAEEGDDVVNERDSKGGRARKDVEEVLLVQELGVFDLAPDRARSGGATRVPTLPPILPRSAAADLLAPLPGDVSSKELGRFPSSMQRHATWSTGGAHDIPSKSGPWSTGRMEPNKTLTLDTEGQRSSPGSKRGPLGRLPPLSSAASLSSPLTPVPDHELFMVEAARAEVAQMSSWYASSSVNGSSTRSSRLPSQLHDHHDLDELIHAEALKHGVSLKRRASRVHRASRGTDSVASEASGGSGVSGVSGLSGAR